MPNELITFQFGNYSNYIGAHYWNIQVNHKLNKSINFSDQFEFRYI